MDLTEYFWNYYTSVILKRVFFFNNFVIGVIQNSEIKRGQEARNEERRNSSNITTNDRLEQLANSQTEDTTITREMEEMEFFTEDLSEHSENYRSTTEYLERLYEMEEALNNKLNTINDDISPGVINSLQDIVYIDNTAYVIADEDDLSLPNASPSSLPNLSPSSLDEYLESEEEYLPTREQVKGILVDRREEGLVGIRRVTFIDDEEDDDAVDNNTDTSEELPGGKEKNETLGIEDSCKKDVTGLEEVETNYVSHDINGNGYGETEKESILDGQNNEEDQTSAVDEVDEVSKPNHFLDVKYRESKDELEKNVDKLATEFDETHNKQIIEILDKKEDEENSDPDTIDYSEKNEDIAKNISITKTIDEDAKDEVVDDKLGKMEKTGRGKLTNGTNTDIKKKSKSTLTFAINKPLRIEESPRPRAKSFGVSRLNEPGIQKEQLKVKEISRQRTGSFGVERDSGTAGLVARRRAVFETGSKEAISREEINRGQFHILTNAEKKVKLEREKRSRY